MTKIENLTRDQLIDRVCGLLVWVGALESERDSAVRENAVLREQVSQLASLVQSSLKRAA